MWQFANRWLVWWKSSIFFSTYYFLICMESACRDQNWVEINAILNKPFKVGDEACTLLPGAYDGRALTPRLIEDMILMRPMHEMYAYPLGAATNCFSNRGLLHFIMLSYFTPGLINRYLGILFLTILFILFRISKKKFIWRSPEILIMRQFLYLQHWLINDWSKKLLLLSARSLSLVRWTLPRLLGAVGGCYQTLGISTNIFLPNTEVN